MERYYQPEIECASVERIKAWQNEKLVKQVKHVYENVPYYRNLMEEKDLKSRLITEFSYRLMVNRNSPLAGMEKITPEVLSDYIEIAHADPYVPSLPYIDVMKRELADDTDPFLP